jgi:hypothetical protein
MRRSVTSLGNGLFAVSGTHSYTAAGSYGFSLSVEDTGGATALGSGTAMVTSAPLRATGKSLKVTGGQPFLGMVASFTDGNPLATAADFTVVITWDNGTASFGTVTGAGPGGTGPFTVTATHTFAKFTGTHTISITIFNRGGTSVTVTDMVTDAPARRPRMAAAAVLAHTGRGSPVGMQLITRIGIKEGTAITGPR